MLQGGLANPWYVLPAAFVLGWLYGKLLDLADKSSGSSTSDWAIVLPIMSLFHAINCYLVYRFTFYGGGFAEYLSVLDKWMVTALKEFPGVIRIPTSSIIFGGAVVYYPISLMYLAVFTFMVLSSLPAACLSVAALWHYLFVKHPAEEIVTQALQSGEPLDNEALADALSSHVYTDIHNLPPEYVSNLRRRADNTRELLEADAKIADAAVRREIARAAERDAKRSNKDNERGSS